MVPPEQQPIFKQQPSYGWLKSNPTRNIRRALSAKLFGPRANYYQRARRAFPDPTFIYDDDDDDDDDSSACAPPVERPRSGGMHLVGHSATIYPPKKRQCVRLVSSELARKRAKRIMDPQILKLRACSTAVVINDSEVIPIMFSISAGHSHGSLSSHREGGRESPTGFYPRGKDPMFRPAHNLVHKITVVPTLSSSTTGSNNCTPVPRRGWGFEKCKSQAGITEPSFAMTFGKRVRCCIVFPDTTKVNTSESVLFALYDDPKLNS
ncbi:hypothetical protein CSOJ01_01861 [Colletotrichum sojae]|uniref:Uncharacterized protein n=1 Tax=Colletotrichum sojae TaxID=2175907 RepID=A0A8H6JTC9_9PEZI|nr:hypothetical protein CSOJ01_01861 [Colletotrichum sojae]